MKLSREFWIYPDIGFFPMKMEFNGEEIHVIEFAAYAALEDDLHRACEKLNRVGKDRDSLRSQLDWSLKNEAQYKNALAEAFKGRDEQRDSALVLVEKWREASEKLATARAALETYAKQVDGVAHIARKALGEIEGNPSHMGFFGGEGVEK